jgi:MoaA/NifB/PqqE/SkfB family radical SAM enzyme
MLAEPETDTAMSDAFHWKMWVYTNFDCNLRCAYCVAESSPVAPRRALGTETIQRVVDEAIALGFRELFFTGGEPFLLDDIYDKLAYAAARMKTTVLTNGMLLKGERLARLRAVAHPNLTVQVSLDGGRAEHHDPYRGAGTWIKTVKGIRALQAAGFHVRLGTTETPANSDHLCELANFRQALGIPAVDHFVRPLARRGFAREGAEVSIETLVPEVTVTASGVYWHPLASPGSDDMLVSAEIFPLAAAVARIREQLADPAQGQPTERACFT